MAQGWTVNPTADTITFYAAPPSGTNNIVVREYGQLDALVHNAGLSVVTKFEDTPLAEFHRVNAVNVDSVILGTQALLPLLIAGGKTRKGGSSVVNVSSVGGLRGAPFNPDVFDRIVKH